MSDEFRILSSGGDSVEVVPLPAGDFPRHPAESYAVRDNFGEMLFHKIPLQNVCIWHSTYRMRRDTLLYGVVDRPILEAHITLQNRYVQSMGTRTNSIFAQGEYNLTGSPYMENRVFFPEGGEYQTLDIHPTAQLLESLSGDFPHLVPFLHELRGSPRHPVSLFSGVNRISGEIRYQIDRLFRCLRNPGAAPAMLNLLAEELLLMMLDASPPRRELKLRRSEVEALHRAREIIQTEVETFDAGELYLTLQQLGEKVGLSAQKLSRGFRMLFETTPYRMLRECRLLKARSLLLDSRLSIGQIAVQSGYRSLESFSKAYRLQFHNAPSRERK